MTAQTGSQYSHSRGLRLLELVVREFGPIFTLDQIKPIAETLHISSPNLRYVISILAKAGWIEILKRGVYLTRSRLYSEEAPAYAVAAALVNPIAISHWSACAYHGITTQSPTVVQASSPAKVITPEMRTGKARSPRGRAVWTVAGYDFEFIHIRPHAFWGFHKIWVNSWLQVNMTDFERTALDLFIRPDIFGGLSASMELLEAANERLDIPRLVDYALKYGTGSVIKRLGWALQGLGVRENDLSPLKQFPVKRYYLLDQRQKKSTSNNPGWRINENLKRP